MFNLLAEVENETNNKTPSEIFAEMVMSETERRYGKEEAERSLCNYRRRYVPDEELSRTDHGRLDRGVK